MHARAHTTSYLPKYIEKREGFSCISGSQGVVCEAWRERAHKIIDYFVVFLLQVTRLGVGGGIKYCIVLNIFNVLKSLFIWYNDVTAFLSQGPSS
jgi:hypothetical protein